MKRYNGILLDAGGNPKAAQSLTVAVSGTTTPSPLFLNGAQISNPLVTDASGRFVFDVISGTYDFLDVDNAVVLSKVQIFDEASPGEWLHANAIPVGPGATPYNFVGPAIDALVGGTLGSGGASNPPSNVTLLTERSGVEYIKKWSIPYSAFLFAGAEATASITMMTLPSRAFAFAGQTYAEIITPFAGTGITTLKMSLATSQIDPGDAIIGDIAPQAATSLTSGAGTNITPVIVTGFVKPTVHASCLFCLELAVTAGGGTLNLLSAGEMDLTWCYTIKP